MALVELPPLTVVSALNLIVRLAGHRMPTDPGLWLAFLVMGTINNVIPFSLIVWGQTEITGDLASILNGTTPLFAFIFAHFLPAMKL